MMKKFLTLLLVLTSLSAHAAGLADSDKLYMWDGAQYFPTWSDAKADINTDVVVPALRGDNLPDAGELDGTEQIVVVKEGVLSLTSATAITQEPMVYPPSISPAALTTSVRNADSKVEGDITGNAATATKVSVLTPVLLDVPEWDMSATATLDVTHGLDATKIQTVNSWIRPDAGVVAVGAGSIEQQGGKVTVGATTVTLDRGASGYYATTDFNQAAGYNRGRLTVWVNDVAMNDPAETPDPPADLGALAAFPGAEGFGAVSVGGRGGAIVKVTNLNDSGAGSLRQALYYTPGPRIVVFEVGGVINLASDIVVREPYLTIAGQTAPSPGIILANYGLRPYTHDVVIQHIAIRRNPSISGGGGDGITVKPDAGDVPYNVMIDHVSAAWAYDESLSTYPGVGNGIDQKITFSNCLVGEGHYGMLIGQDAKKVSMLRNIVVSATDRYPRITGLATEAQIVNNLFYNPTSAFFSIVGSIDGPNEVAYAGNFFVAGPSTDGGAWAISDSSIQAGSEIYAPSAGANANAVEGTGLVRSTLDSYIVTDPPAGLSSITVAAVAGLEASIVTTAGSRPADREVNDTRFLSELAARGGSVKDRDVTEFNAWVRPDPTSRDIDPLLPADPNGIYNGSWTNMDYFLYLQAQEVE